MEKKEIDPRLVYEQRRIDPETGITWRIIGRNKRWVILEFAGAEEDYPQIFPVEIVQTWPVVKK